MVVPLQERKTSWKSVMQRALDKLDKLWMFERGITKSLIGGLVDCTGHNNILQFAVRSQIDWIHHITIHIFH